ncbi:hypothetical protein ACH5RR_015567 [Cinchona calisaya]|uniref:GAG-pre-integrase domain-containing protein n=1 Tax=Cinchona calisaya TaxID=153742 RepID=A0ABD2ZTW9_9GENT
MKLASYDLPDKQQVLSVIMSLLEPMWGHVKLVLRHNENTKTIDDISRRLELETACKNANHSAAMIAQSKQNKGKKFQRKNNKNKKVDNIGSNQAGKGTKRQRGKYDTGATKHVTYDRPGFVDYHQITSGRSFVMMGNGAEEEVLGFIMDGLFFLDCESNNASATYVSTSSSESACDSIKWRARLGHIGQDRMSRLAREELLGYLTKINLQTCEPCLARSNCGTIIREQIGGKSLIRWRQFKSLIDEVSKDNSSVVEVIEEIPTLEDNATPIFHIISQVNSLTTTVVDDQVIGYTFKYAHHDDHTFSGFEHVKVNKDNFNKEALKSFSKKITDKLKKKDNAQFTLVIKNEIKGINLNYMC